jgi:hypothetical protein
MKFSRILAALAVAAVAGMASSVKASPLINLQILGSTDGTNYSSNLTVASGQTVFYEVVGTIAPASTSNSQSSLTVATAQNSTDGIGGLNNFSLNDLASQLMAAGALQSGYDGGTGHSAGTANGSISGIIALLATGTAYQGGSANVTIYSGSFTAGTFATDTISGSGPSTFNAKINTTSGDKNLVNKANGSTDPYVGIASLGLSEGEVSPVPSPTVIGGIAAIAPALLVGWVRRRWIA